MSLKSKILTFLFSRLSIELAAIYKSDFTIFLIKRVNGIQLSCEQIKIISRIIKNTKPSNLLVFGVGHDSEFWYKINKGGLTIFLEDNKNWLEKITRKSKGIKVFHVNYNSKRKDWKTFLESPSLLKMNLPDEVQNQKWDIILVDGPAAFNDQKPGRMKSIFLSSMLVNNTGDIFVHDCDREVEDIFCNKFLKKDNLKLEIDAKIGLLRHYYINNFSK